MVVRALLSEHGSSEIEKVMNILLNVERHLDEIKASIDQEQVMLRELGQKAAESAIKQVISEVNENIQKTLGETRSQAEAEADEIITKSEKSIKELTW